MAFTRNILEDLLQVFKASYKSVLPQEIVRTRVQYNRYTDTLQVLGKQIPLVDKKLYVVGAGKGVQFLAREIEALMGPRIEKGIVSIPEGSLDPETQSDKIHYYEGAKDNLPDENAQSTAKLIKELVSNLTSEDILMVLITGGGSALLPLPIEPITLDEKTQVIKKLANAGADIIDLNIVRKRISAIKGGKLANCSASRIVTLIISDIVNDPFDFIASGPTVKNKDDPQKAITVLKRYFKCEEIPESIKEVLETNNHDDKIQSGKFQNFIEGLKVDSNNEFESDCYEEFPTAKVLNFLLASNRMSVGDAMQKFNWLNWKIKEPKQMKGRFFPVIISRCVSGNVKEVAETYYQLTKIFGKFLKEKIDSKTLLCLIKNMNIEQVHILCDFEGLDKPEINEKIISLILAGETTVEVSGTGKGGRNQHLALEFSKLLHDRKHRLKNLDVYMLSAGTDGIDGPTDAAGAIGHIDLFSESAEDGINANEYLNNNDSYNFFKTYKDGKYHVITGHTNTNVMDIHLITIERINTF